MIPRERFTRRMRSALILFLSLALLAGTFGCQAQKKPLRIASAIWVGYGPLYLARDAGLFEEEGVQVELIVQQDFKQQFASMAAGEIDGIANVVDATISYYIPDLKYQMVLAMDDSMGGDGIGASKEIQSIADLKGKQIAYETGATAQFFLNVMLFRDEMTEKDITHIEMIGADAGAALLAGRVDAAVSYEPYLTEIRNSENTHVLVDTREAPGLITDVLMFRQDVIEDRPKDVQAVVNAYFKALDYWEKHPEESIAIMAKGMGGWISDPVEFKNTLQFVQFLDLPANQAYFADPSNEGQQILETTQNAIEIWGQILNLGNLPEPKELINAKFVQNVR